MSKTYKECLDEVARKYNGFPNQPYKDWKDMESTLTLIPTKESLGNLFARFEEASLLYGESIKSGCEHVYSLPKWISVKDQLPELFKKVLMFGDRGTIAISCVDASLSIDTYPFEEGENVTHWQPLPEPPKP